jgi:hypothetical protein
MKTPYFKSFIITYISLAISCATIAGAGFSPIPLTADSYNQDMVVERTAIHAPVVPPLTTASETGPSNYGDAWYEQGFDTNYPDTGLPVHGSTITWSTGSQPDHSYTFAANYATNDVVMVDPTVTRASFTLTTPAAYSGLSFLSASCQGSTAVICTLHHSDGTAEIAVLTVPDWFSGANTEVLTANGRVNVQSLAFDSEESGNPRLFGLDITLTNTTSMLTNVDFAFSAGGHAAIFAVSGSTGDTFTPIAVTGYNEDMIVESNIYPSVVSTPLNATTASMGDGTGNTAETLYEQGYNPSSLSSGLPAPGSTITSASDSTVLYTLASSYTNNNAVLIDGTNAATITPTDPTNYSSLSFLTVSANGPTLIDYIVAFKDGTSQNGQFVAPDWYNNTPYAFIANGRVTVGSGAFSSVDSGNPRLYSAQILLANNLSPVTSIQLSADSSGTGPSAHAVIFAVSGGMGPLPPSIVVQPLAAKTFAGSNTNFTVSVSGSAPFGFQWQEIVNGIGANLSDGASFSGSTAATLSFLNPSLGNGGNYVCIITNSAGSVTSSVVTLTVLSTLPDVTVSGDPISIYGGHQGESVEGAIDDTTSKYLNFGVSVLPAPPFAGPVGFVVTPSLGSTCVTALRFYTANDSPERDPADYTLEGSNDDGTTFTTISSGPLALPDGRNAAGLNIDPISLYDQEVDFANRATYTTYRVSFTHVKTESLANSMQIGEVELLGISATPTAILTIAPGANGTVTISTSLAGELQSTTVLNGSSTAWQDEGPISASVTLSNTGAARFYRVKVQ